jgi:hypothetical protein
MLSAIAAPGGIAKVMVWHAPNGHSDCPELQQDKEAGID